MHAKTLGTLAGLCVGASVFVGCTNQTEGDRTIQRAATIEDAGHTDHP